MLSIFHEYLAQKIINYFSHHTLKSGDKFNVQFENEEHVNLLTSALNSLAKQQSLFEDFNWDEVSFKASSINFNGVKLIISTNLNNITPDFLTTLRNKVGKEDPLFKDTAILFIHNSTLDSIVGGTESLQKKGMPLSHSALKKDITDNISKSQLDNVSKSMLKFAVAKIEEDVTNVSTSVFEYEPIVRVLNNGIDDKTYRDFGLFKDSDPDLKSMSEKELENRLKENNEKFTLIENIHKYGDPEQELESHFDSDGAEKLSQEEWMDYEYNFIKQSENKKKEKKELEYLGAEYDEKDLYWERSDGSTKAKERKRNVIIFNPDHKTEISVSFLFDRFVKKDNLRNQVNNVASTSGKKIIVMINTERENTTFAKFQYKEDGVTFIFKIAVIEFEKDFFREIESNYILQIIRKEQYIEIPNFKGSITLNSGSTSSETIFLENNKTVTPESVSNQLILEKDEEYSSDDEVLLKLTLQLSQTKIPFGLSEDIQKPVPITGINVKRLKYKNKKSLYYTEDEKLKQGNQDFYIKETQLKNSLEAEKLFVTEGALFLREINGELEKDELDLPGDIAEKFNDFIEYFKSSGLLPSLTFWDEELTLLAIEYVNSVLKYIKNIGDGKILTSSEKNILKIGTVETLTGFREIKFSPLHPLVVSYQIELNKNIQEDLTEEIYKRLTPNQLLPYIYHDQRGIYKPVEQHHSPDWIYFYSNKNSRYNSPSNFVSKLVKEKIEEFTTHFNFLFNKFSSAPLKLNAINLGDCREVLQGIFEYYSTMLKNKTNISNLIPIDLFIYGDEDSYNAFEEISFYDDVEETKSHFDIKLDAGTYSEEDLLNAFREKVHFYKRDESSDEYEYAHISFYELNQNIDETFYDMNNIETGISVNGLISSVTSVFLGDSYRTGFGTKFLGGEMNQLLNLSISLNSLARASSSQNPFKNKDTIVTAFSEQDLFQLDKIYESSHWVTFIEPKFDLNFFKNNQSSDKNLLILHYSDQYSSSTSYDAITVTQKSTQYQLLIKEFLVEKLGHENIDTSKIINLFNSINGDWLLRLIGNNTQFPREKISILSAVKFCLSYYYHPDIIWVPLSLEEVLRVSGAVGLKQSEGLFSAKNLGVSGTRSDDLLLIGIEDSKNGLKLHYYPVEVKIGSADINKAVQQVRATRKALDEFLQKGSFKNSIYRDFMVQLLLVSIKKMKLYNVWEEQKWDSILNGEIREKLISDDYKIVDTFNEYIQEGAIVSFLKGVHFKSEKILENVLQIELPVSRGYQYLIEDIEELKNMIHGGNTDFDETVLLKNKYFSLVNESNEDYDTETQEHQGEKSAKEGKENGQKDKENKVKPESSIQPLKVLFGHKLENKSTPLYWYPTDTSKIMHTNTGIIGTMGTGKTQFTKSLITQLYKNSHLNVNGTKIDILIFDYKGDYIKDDFINTTDAKVYDLFHLPYNPLALFKGERHKPMLPLHTANSIKETIGTAYGLGPVQRGLLRELIMEAYNKKGIDKARPDTWDLSAPTITDVYNIFLEREDIKEDSLTAALRDLADFEIFMPDSQSTKPLYELNDGITVINLSSYDEGMQNLVVGITLDTFYSQMQTNGHSQIKGEYRELTKMILVDEADNFLSKGFDSLKKILKEGREYGVGTILSTQFLSHFATTDNDYSQYLLTWIVHQVSDLKRKEVQAIFNTENREEEDRLMNKIRQLEKHQSIVTSVSSNKLEIMEDKPFWQLLNE
ncbi:DNA phosphorothioation-dependent restriction protein DptH [Rossellomorea sp. BNER]|uniref:DNA phosphorothioation-dependent restriction protein DptH n=1 Tax=Rossellomorea sp. BNER TaxID=2962031 RepID=UPI003AF2BAD7|nr:DNA phosphorothioation-dependent restriction protein DptH [Rossellomorea sp. BNER]